MAPAILTGSARRRNVARESETAPNVALLEVA